jgi:hypothetical protein
MHDGCSGSFVDGKEIADKVRMMGYHDMLIQTPLDMVCANCNGSFKMETMVSHCPLCDMVYAVTPCHANNPQSVLPAGIGY